MEGWRTTTLGDLFAIGSSKRVLQSQWQSSGVPFYRGREITALGELGHVDNELFISEALYSEYSSKYGVPAPGDIMLTAIGTIGNSYVVQPGDRFYFKDASVLWMANKDAIDSAFVNHWLKSDAFRDQLDIGNGATVDTLTIQKLKSIRLSCPADRCEQRRIVAILDEAFEAIATAKANTEKNLQNAREVFAAFTASIFQRGGASWQKGNLMSFAEAISTGPFGSLLHKSDYVSDGVPLVNPINIVDGLIVPDPSKLVDTETRQRLQSYILRAGDIIVGRRGEIGRCAVVGPNEEGWVCGTGCFFIRPGSTIRPEFIAHLIRSPEYRARLERASTGATMKNLSNTALGELQIAAPTLSEQDQLLALIGRLSEECGRAESVSEQKLSALDELKKSLLHQAFTGQLTSKTTEQQLEAVA